MLEKKALKCESRVDGEREEYRGVRVERKGECEENR